MARVSVKRPEPVVEVVDGELVEGARFEVTVYPFLADNHKAFMKMAQVIARAAHDFVESASGGKEGA
jgi:hypothetical protein